MSFNFVEKNFIIGGESSIPPALEFYKRGFILGSGKVSPSWRDIILSGNTALTLVNAKANGLNYLKLFGGTELLPQEYIDTVTLSGKCEQRNLPVGYTQVEYIESTGTQYINTGINPTADKLQINCKMQRTTDIYSNFFGAVAGSAPRDGVRAYMQLETARMLVQSGAGSKTISFTTGLEVLEMQATFVNGGDATIVINGDTQTFSDVNTTLSTGMLIGAAKVGSSTNGIGTFKIWSFEIKKDDVQVFNGIPCKNSNNEYGLYDTVSGNFFVSESSDGYIGSNEAVPSPDTPMDIICNNGVIKGYATAEGFSIQDGIPTPANQLSIKNFEQGGMVLRKVGDYADTYDATTKTITRNVGVKVLDGSENWGFSTSQYVANLIISDMAYGDGSGSWAINGLSTHYVGTSLANASMPDYSIKYSNTTTALTTARIFVKPNYTTLQDFKEFLTQQYQNNTPVTLYYPLLIPTTEVWNDDYYIDGVTETVENTGKNLAKILTASGGIGYVKIPQGLLNKTVTLSSSATDFMQYTIGNTAYTGIWTSSNKTTTFTVTQAMIDTVGLWVRKQSTYSAMTPEELASINLQLEIGSSATEYEPYYNYGSATAEMLLSVGDYNDTQEVLSGTVTRNVGIKVLNGLEDWEFVSATYPYFRVVTDIPTNSKTSANNELCTHCIPLNVGGSNTNQSISITKRSSAYSYLYLFARLDEVCEATSENLTIWKQWLTDQYENGTPVIIVYPLAESTTENVNKQLLTKGNVIQTAGSLSDMSINTVSSIHTTPAPEQPLDINCNNGVVKLSPNLLNANVASMSQAAAPSSSISIDFNKWYAGVAYNGYMTPNRVRSFSSGVGTITFTGADNSYGCARFFKLKPNTNYVVSCSNPTADRKCAIMCYIDNGNNTYMATTQIKTPYALPLQFTTNDNVVYGIVLYSPQDTSITYTNLQLEEGSTPTPYMPYGAIYADGITETVEVTGKNLMDGENEFGNLDGDGQPSGSSKNYIRTKNFTTIEPNKTYTIKVNNRNNASQSYILFYDENKNLLARTSAAAMIQSFYYFTTPANSKYIKAFIYAGTAWEELFDWQIQLEYGNTATDYEPYFNGGSATAENLLKVGNYQDVQSVINGNVTRNVGVKLFDGNETFRTAHTTTYYRYICDRALLNGASNVAIANYFCSHFNVKPIIPNITVAYKTEIDFWLPIDTELTDVTKFKQFLASQYANGTPVTIIYPLATATTETVTAQPLNIQAGTNIVEITQASIDNLELEVSYKAGVSVTITEIQNAQLDDNVEVTING